MNYTAINQQWEWKINIPKFNLKNTTTTKKRKKKRQVLEINEIINRIRNGRVRIIEILVDVLGRGGVTFSCGKLTLVWVMLFLKKYFFQTLLSKQNCFIINKPVL